ncbi:MAG: diaminopimelate epimerase [Kiritimatiellae bacterium]|nr:diaminopimelate epimerase [Kiritimatiellia bacterium]
MNMIRFAKMHGAGNDFVLVDDRPGAFPCDDHRRIAALSSRREGVGCEGVILVQKSDCADFRMRFFNPDGTEVDLCGNGARCVAAFAREIGAAKTDVMRFETAAGMIDAEILDPSLVRIAMPQPRDFRDDFVVAGVPHKIIVAENLAKVDVEGEGRRIRMSDEFAPDGTNVDFVCFRPPAALVMRTYERGVEAETGACGTGAVAAAVIGVADYGLEFPVHVKTNGGYELVVDGQYDGEDFSEITLAGPVKKVFEGEIDWDSLDAVSE